MNTAGNWCAQLGQNGLLTDYAADPDAERDVIAGALASFDFVSLDRRFTAL